MIESIFSSFKRWFKRSLSFILAFILLFAFLYREFGVGFHLIAIFFQGLIKYNFFLLSRDYRTIFSADISQYLTPENKSLFDLLLISLVTFYVLYHISSFMVAQFVLPVNAFPDRAKAYKYLIKYSKDQHGLAIFVKEGEKIEKPKETANIKPGVILVDLSSAVALRKQEKTKSLLFGKDKGIESDTIDDIVVDEKRDLKNKKNANVLDSKGPGVVFTESGQQIFAALDLRKQSRSSDEIEAYTRDGIRVKTKISITFSLSDEPETITVGDLRDKNGIKGLIFSSEDQNGRIKLKDVFDLDEIDAVDVANFIKNGSSDYQSEKEAEVSVAPYKFYRNRILKAAYSRARKTGGEVRPWYDAPMELATDVFRKMLSGIQYDDLFSGSHVELPDTLLKMEGKKEVPPLFISTFKGNFGRNVKMKGLLKFQRCVRKDGLPFILGQTIDAEMMEKLPPVAFSEPKYNSVRKYGIAILSANFGEIRPVDSKIQEKMVENWRTKLQNEINLVRAEYELEAIRVKNRNRAQIQHETTYLLSSIFQSAPHFEEALALRVLNALETAVTDPSRQEITSTELYTMLENLYKWLLTEGDDTSYPPIKSPQESNQETRKNQDDDNNKLTGDLYYG